VKSTNKMILLVAIVCAAPFISAWVAYYFFKPEGGSSYGQLLKTQPVQALPFSAQDAERVKGKWLLIQQDNECEKTCAETLYATRQARTMLNKETDRLVRVLIGNNPKVSDEVRRAHPDVIALNSPAPTPELAGLLNTKTVLIDPLNNQVIAWDRSQDLKGIKRLNGDLQRLMRATKWSTEPQSR
jgi:hypothetical protein